MPNASSTARRQAPQLCLWSGSDPRQTSHPGIDHRMALTYMSTTVEIRKRIVSLHGRQLFFLRPLLPAEPAVRELFVSREIIETVNEPWADNWMGQRHQEFRATLDSFSRGDRLTVSEQPYTKGPETVVARVDPVADEIWDVRCIAPNARIRCLGAFGGRDMFVALTWFYREDVTTKAAWNDEINRCKSEWNRLFAQIKRYKGKSIDDYLSNCFPI